MRERWKWCVALGAGMALIAACSAAGGEEGNPNPTGGGSGSGSGGAGGSGAGSGGSGALTGTGGAGGTGASGFDASAGGSGGVVNPGDAACTGVSQEAKTLFQPADIIWAVDTSGSMIEEAAAVQANINTFSQGIVQTGIDVHVVMIAAYPFSFLPGICVPAPLGSGVCPPNGSDTKLPNFFHHPSAGVDSVDAARKLVQLYNDYAFMLRPDSLKYVVVVTDDDSRTNSGSGGTGDPGVYDNDPTRFVNDFTALNPAILSDGMGNPTWKLSAVYSFTQCPNAATVGQVWKSIVDMTGGIHGDICQCPPGQAAACAQTFATIFNELATKIIQGSQPLTCEWSIPVPPQGQTVDPNQINVEFVDDNGNTETLLRADNEAACDPNLGGWYYDDNQNPTAVKACPASCTKIEAASQGKVNVLFGCATQTLPT